MSDIQSILDNEAALDAQIEEAVYLLKEAAARQGTDLEREFDQGDLNDLIAATVEDIAARDSGEGTGDEGGEQESGDDGKTASLTYSQISLETAKVAAANGINLAELSQEAHDELFNKVAEALSDPDAYAEQQKIAEYESLMDHYGRCAARGWVDEINKLASAAPDDDDDKSDEEKKQERLEKKEKVANKAKELAGRAWGAAKTHGGKALDVVGKKERGLHGAVGEKIRNLRGKAPGANQYGKDVNVGRALSAGVAGTGAAGAGYAHHRNKKASGGTPSLAELAESIDTLRAAGYDL
jgi:hypothetical protein